MFIIEVIPITKGLGADTLSYFTAQNVPLGAIVTIPLRKKMVQGIVVAVRSAEDLKSEIRKASFAFKKLDQIKSASFFSKPFMEMASIVAEHYATGVGSVINILAPEYILKNIAKLKIPKSETTKTEVKSIQEKYAVQGDDEERFGTWKSLIRQEFARKHSLFFLFPTIEEANYSFDLLEKGIEGYVFLLHGALPPKKIIETWNAIIKEPHPVAVIATGGFLSLPREDIETIIVERESSRAYKVPRRPYLDVRHVAEVLAEKKGIKIFFADNFLRIETLARSDASEGSGEIVEASPFKFRSLSTAKDTLVDMRQYKSQTQNDEKTNFKIVSPEVENLIVRTKDESEHMLILATRRGLAPTTICGDCQNIVTCNNCGAIVVLHSTYFLCHHCGERRSSEEYCKVCGSWRLGTVGIGVDLVFERIKRKFPELTIFRIDSDVTPNDKSARSVVQKFRAKPGSILIGTEMMLQYIHDKVENSAIITLDTLFSLPDFRIHEKILSLLIRMRALTTRNFVVQTRKADEKVFEYGLKGNMSDFYKATLEERKKFNYPPFSILIKITLEGKKDEIVKSMEEAQNILSPYEVDVFPAFTQSAKGNLVLHGLIRASKDRWVDTVLIDKLRNLPPSITVKVDPETLL